MAPRTVEENAAHLLERHPVKDARDIALFYAYEHHEEGSKARQYWLDVDAAIQRQARG